MKIFAASAGGLRPKDTRGHFFLPEEGGFGAFSVSSARGFLCGRSALKYKRENRNFLYQTFLFRFLGFCLFSKDKIEIYLCFSSAKLLHGALFDGKRFIILANLKNLTEDKVPMGLAAVC